MRSNYHDNQGRYVNTPICEIIPRIVVLVGLPACGKSTYVREQKLPALSSDHIRHLICDDAAEQGVNARIFHVLRVLLRERLALVRPLTVIDATSLNRTERLPYIEIALEFGADIEALFFDVPFEVCQARNAARERVVPPDAMLLLAGRLEPPSISEGFTRVSRLTPETLGPPPEQGGH